jgi:hypothetical protein
MCYHTVSSPLREDRSQHPLVMSKKRGKSERALTSSTSLKCQACHLREGNLRLIKLHLGFLSSQQKWVFAYRVIVSLVGLIVIVSHDEDEIAGLWWRCLGRHTHR